LLHVDDLSSDDEDGVRRNTIGRVPLHWYDAFDHIGYDIAGTKMVKRKGKDSIDMALQEKDNPNASRLVYDMYNDREVVLSDRQLEIIRRIQAACRI
jgi:ribosome biogenesis protein ERB1